jgi:protein SCO1/2
MLQIYPDQSKPEVGIDEKSGTVIPEGLRFFDEYGKTVFLTELINKPTIISLVYYRCPGICSPLLTGLSKTVSRMDIEAGKDFNIVTISFDTAENYLVASEKKRNYLDNMDKKLPADSWRFLTGDKENVSKITDALGFRYQPQGTDFMHAAAIMVLSKDGKIIRYLYGTEFLPLDLKLAVIEASEGRTGSSINKFLKLCYSYDPEGRKYVLNVTRIAGSGIILILTFFFAFLIAKKKTNKTN